MQVVFLDFICTSHGRVTDLEGDPQNVLRSKNFGGGKSGRTRPENAEISSDRTRLENEYTHFAEVGKYGIIWL